MRAQLKDLQEIPAVPDNPHAKWFEMLIGPHQEQGEEIFMIFVCTSRWIADDVRANGPRLAPDTLIVDVLDEDSVRRELVNRVASTEGDTWTEIGLSIARWSRWEFGNNAKHPASDPM